MRVGTLIRCYHNTQYLKSVLKSYSWVDKILLQNYRFPSVAETTDDTEEIALSLNLKNLEIKKGEPKTQHELINEALESLQDLDYVFFADSDELIKLSDQQIMLDRLESERKAGVVVPAACCRIKDYCLDLIHQLPPRSGNYNLNWCMVLFNPKLVQFTKIRLTNPSPKFHFHDITMHHFGYIFPAEDIKWKVEWEAKEEIVWNKLTPKEKEAEIWRAINARTVCEPPPWEIMQLIENDRNT